MVAFYHKSVQKIVNVIICLFLLHQFTLILYGTETQQSRCEIIIMIPFTFRCDYDDNFTVLLYLLSYNSLDSVQLNIFL